MQAVCSVTCVRAVQLWYSQEPHGVPAYGSGAAYYTGCVLWGQPPPDPYCCMGSASFIWVPSTKVAVIHALCTLCHAGYDGFNPQHLASFTKLPSPYTTWAAVHDSLAPTTQAAQAAWGPLGPALPYGSGRGSHQGLQATSQLWPTHKIHDSWSYYIN